MQASTDSRVIVFAKSFLDEPHRPMPERESPKKMLDRVAERHGVQVEYRCERNPADPLSTSELDGAVAVIADLERYEAELLQRVGAGCGGTLGLIARYGIGFNSVDIDTAKTCGVLVTNTPGASAPPTAEWAVATLLDVAGRRMEHYRTAAAGRPKGGPGRLDVSGTTLGVIGSGTIGKRVVSLLRGFDMDVIAYDPYPDQAWADENGVEYVDLATLCRNADFITLHAAGEQRIIGETELAMMKPTAVLVNCARGRLVDNRAAYAAVKEQRLWGYGLDEVWDHPDLSLEEANVIVSPHVGSDTDLGKTTMQQMSAQSVIDYLEGHTPKHVVNK